MNDEAKMNPDPRRCTCHPDDDPPQPCPRKYALRDCRIAAAAARLRHIADSVPADEVPGELHAVARQLEAIV
jgi:hypothetical protein